MRDRDLYAQVLGLQSPWTVSDVALNSEQQEVVVRVENKSQRPPCPVCRSAAPRYDSVVRRWRHLDTCQYRTILEAKVPRVKCAEHGVKQIAVPWAEPGTRFTALFEAIVIDWLLEASVSAVSRRMKLTWDEVDGIQQRAVARGLARRESEEVSIVGVDETSFQKRHEYVTVISSGGAKVLHVSDGRGKKSLKEYYKSLTDRQIKAIEAVSMDMWEPYIQATMEHIPDAEEKIAFDKFHVAKHLGDAVDKVRRTENKELVSAGDESLKGTKHLWLQNPDNMHPSRWHTLQELKDVIVKTSRAWAIKETAMCLWSYVSRGWARKAWEKWLSWAMRSRLEPIKKAARMIRDHLDGILNAVTKKVTNAGAESLNAKIQKVKRRACGFRNRERFRIAIYFHLGGLDLYPEGLATTHRDS